MAKKATPAPAEPAETAAEQPYYLQRAHIKDFRSIRDAVVEFKPGLNIIIGPNGSGKTNFIECITNCLTEPKRDFSGEAHLILAGDIPIQVEASKSFNEIDESLRAAGLLSNTHQQKVILRRKNEEFRAESFLEAQYSLINLARSNKIDYKIIRLVTIPHGIPSEYSLVRKPVTFRANLNGASSYSSNSNSIFSTSLAAAINHAISSAHHKANNNTLPTNVEIRNAVDEVEKSYNDILLQSLRNITSIENIQYTGNVSPYVDESRQLNIVDMVRLEFQIKQNWLPFSSLSSGTQRMFYIISEIITSGFFSVNDRAPQSTLNAIILLEEPELGIHPHQLHLLLNFLREQSEKHQLIITTHSPQVLDMLREDELDRITICELHKTKGTQFRKLKKTQQDDARRYMREVGFLSDYWRMGDLEAAK